MSSDSRGIVEDKDSKAKKNGHTEMTDSELRSKSDAQQNRLVVGMAPGGETVPAGKVRSLLDRKKNPVRSCTIAFILGFICGRDPTLLSLLA